MKFSSHASIQECFRSRLGKVNVSFSKSFGSNHELVTTDVWLADHIFIRTYSSDGGSVQGDGLRKTVSSLTLGTCKTGDARRSRPSETETQSLKSGHDTEGLRACGMPPATLNMR
ncbi:hypothetical protein PM082_005882 [Marasmius tenuissimus]|nr:hypothetical protein PM082_005882 [Marasmius tenuissimus]